jgi:hypothetical protein
MLCNTLAPCLGWMAGTCEFMNSQAQLYHRSTIQFSSHNQFCGDLHSRVRRAPVAFNKPRSGEYEYLIALKNRCTNSSSIEERRAINAELQFFSSCTGQHRHHRGVYTPDLSPFTTPLLLFKSSFYYF